MCLGLPTGAVCFRMYIGGADVLEEDGADPYLVEILCIIVTVISKRMQVGRTGAVVELICNSTQFGLERKPCFVTETGRGILHPVVCKSLGRQSLIA